MLRDSNRFITREDEEDGALSKNSSEKESNSKNKEEAILSNASIKNSNNINKEETECHINTITMNNLGKVTNEFKIECNKIRIVLRSNNDEKDCIRYNVGHV